MFAGGAKATTPGDDKTPELYEQIGRLKVEFDGVKKPGRQTWLGERVFQGIQVARRSGKSCLGLDLGTCLLGIERESLGAPVLSLRRNYRRPAVAMLVRAACSSASVGRRKGRAANPRQEFEVLTRSKA
ncbi:MAG TPA: hypothetical protein VH092_13055 [Urbifossiella sp.]|nr:hypothetical protein [Urbifossiella sp.]